MRRLERLVDGAWFRAVETGERAEDAVGDVQREPGRRAATAREEPREEPRERAAVDVVHGHDERRRARAIQQQGTLAPHPARGLRHGRAF
ncbi:MAG: hypothetical protein H6713_35955 [Myxococcales bacterium]|nr:hypothetical protein [Myxococcales bacterium]